MSIWCHRFDQNSNEDIVRISALNFFLASWKLTDLQSPHQEIVNVYLNHAQRTAPMQCILNFQFLLLTLTHQAKIKTGYVRLLIKLVSTIFLGRREGEKEWYSKVLKRIFAQKYPNNFNDNVIVFLSEGSNLENIHFVCVA